MCTHDSLACYGRQRGGHVPSSRIVFGDEFRSKTSVRVCRSACMRVCWLIRTVEPVTFYGERTPLRHTVPEHHRVRCPTLRRRPSERSRRVANSSPQFRTLCVCVCTRSVMVYIIIIAIQLCAFNFAGNANTPTNGTPPPPPCGA